MTAAKIDECLLRLIECDAAAGKDTEHDVLVTADDDGPPLGELLDQGLRQVITGVYTGRLRASHILALADQSGVRAIKKRKAGTCRN